jgi:hypothetical protein
VIHFLHRGPERLVCEARLNPSGDGYQLAIWIGAEERIEDFRTVQQLLSREHELLAAWKAIGWEPLGDPKRPAEPVS